MRILAISTALLTLAACGAGTGPEVGNRVDLGFQLARTSSAALASAAPLSHDGPPIVGAPPVITTTAAGQRITRDTDVIVITKAQFVVRDVTLRSALATCADDDDSETSLRDGSSDDDDCPMLRVGPFLVDMSVSGADGARVAVPVPAGTYASLSLRLHKVTSGDSADAAFRQANPDFRGISVRLEGSYNGTPFVFVNDVNARMDVPLASPLTIGASGGDVTVSVDLSRWFLRPQGGLYAPASANVPGAVRAAVQNNIRSAFRAFRDRDRDGRED